MDSNVSARSRIKIIPPEFLDIPMGQKHPSTLNAEAASLMINKTIHYVWYNMHLNFRISV